MELSLDRLAKMTPEEREKTVNLLRQQAVVLTFQNLIAEASDKCTRKCITNPGTTLSGGEKQCLQRCLDRFIESHNLVSQTLQKRVQQQTGTGAFGMNSGPSFS